MNYIETDKIRFAKINLTQQKISTQKKFTQAKFLDFVNRQSLHVLSML